MIVKKIIYLDSSIKICCVKTKKEDARITSKNVQHALICFSIGLVNNPLNRIVEIVKVENGKIEFVG